MGFVTPALLAGAALIAVPIVLHLIMRREAQRLTFPALRFVEQRRSVNQHRLRLRHLLLLALRCAIIALLAFALARPTLRSAGAAGKEGAPIASALVFDNSLRMQYQQNNRTSLQKAKELGKWLINQLPPENPVTVVDRAGRQRGQDLDRDAAGLRIERLEPSAVVRPLADALQDATHWIEGKKDYRGEIYVFTDMAADAWSPDTLTQLAKSLDQLPGTNVYLIDVGAAEPKDLGLGQLRLSSEQVAPGGLLQLNTNLVATGDANTKESTVELFVGDGSRAPEKRGQQLATLRGDRPIHVEFSLSGLPLGTHQGFVRIVGRDGLACDDIRYFTVDVRPPSKILLLGEKPDDTLFLHEALSPTAASGVVQSRFECQVDTFDELTNLRLSTFAAVCLLDPPPLSDASWKSLANFAEGGGGVGIFLGRHARREEMNSGASQKLLPAKLRWQSREATYLRPIATENPALHGLGELADTAPWSEFPVFKYWELGAGSQAAQVIASYANGKPALLERQLGSGSVILMTTPISDSAHNDPWNLLPTGPEPWPFLALANSVVQYLAGVGQTRLNYQAGQTIVLPLSLDEQLSGYVLQLPDGTAVRQSLTPGQRNLSIGMTDMPGNYRARAGGQIERLDRGFSVNVPTDMSRLDRIAAADVVKALGKERTHVATNRGELSARVGLGRIGRELFPFLILAVALFMAVEQWLANRFYGASSAVGAGVVSNATADDRHMEDRSSLAAGAGPARLPVSSGQL
ncbi:MAG TPA: BatA domain-containing protein [Lacipirellulaceae bacterium]|nr:BatA domain-containing protein [Lacipirellulaceae bacterium]